MRQMKHYPDSYTCRWRVTRSPSQWQWRSRQLKEWCRWSYRPPFCKAIRQTHRQGCPEDDLNGLANEWLSWPPDPENWWYRGREAQPEIEKFKTPSRSQGFWPHVKSSGLRIHIQKCIVSITISVVVDAHISSHTWRKWRFFKKCQKTLGGSSLPHSNFQGQQLSLLAFGNRQHFAQFWWHLLKGLEPKNNGFISWANKNFHKGREAARSELASKQNHQCVSALSWEFLISAKMRTET